MIEHKLVVPKPILRHIQSMKYDGTEYIDYYLSRDISHKDYIATIPLVRARMGESEEVYCSEEADLIDALGKYLDINKQNSAVILHFHPLKGPSSKDEGGMKRNFKLNNRLGRYAIFVGPDGPRFYETDGKSVFPIRSKLTAIIHSERIGSLQRKVFDDLRAAYSG